MHLHTSYIRRICTRSHRAGDFHGHKNKFDYQFEIFDKRNNIIGDIARHHF